LLIFWGEGLAQIIPEDVDCVPFDKILFGFFDLSMTSSLNFSSFFRFSSFNLLTNSGDFSDVKNCIRYLIDTMTLSHTTKAPSEARAAYSA
jgi:hypothetical protein